MKRIILLSFALLICNFCFSQFSWTTAEVYLIDGKVYKGQAKMINVDYGIVRYRANAKAEKIKFQIDEIDSLKFALVYSKLGRNNKVTRTVDLEKYIPLYSQGYSGRKFFARVILDGKAKLIGRLGQKGYEGLHVVIYEDGKQKMMKQRATLGETFIKRAVSFFQNCPDLVNKIESNEFKKKDMKEIVEFYNSNCEN